MYQMHEVSSGDTEQYNIMDFDSDHLILLLRDCEFDWKIYSIIDDFSGLVYVLGLWTVHTYWGN